jgi:hypothetical protein
MRLSVIIARLVGMHRCRVCLNAYPAQLAISLTPLPRMPPDILMIVYHVHLGSMLMVLQGLHVWLVNVGDMPEAKVSQAALTVMLGSFKNSKDVVSVRNALRANLRVILDNHHVRIAPVALLRILYVKAHAKTVDLGILLT